MTDTPPERERDDHRARRPPRAKPKKVTPEELEQRWDAWAERRRARRDEHTPAQRAQRTRLIIAGALATCLVGAVLTGGALERQVIAEQVAAAAEIDDLTAKISTARIQRDQAADADEVRETLRTVEENARALAAQVAEAQNTYAQLRWNTHQAPARGDGLPPDEELREVEHRRDLAEYFAPRIFVGDNPEALYGWSSTYDIASDELDPRLPWYIRYDDTEPSAPGTGAWKVDAVLPDLDELGRARVMWSYRDTGEAGTVLAWAKGVYDDDDGVFTRLELTVTSQGAAHQKDTERIVTEVPEIDLKIDPDAVDPTTGEKPARDETKGDSR